MTEQVYKGCANSYAVLRKKNEQYVDVPLAPSAGYKNYFSRLELSSLGEI